ncbi:nucleotide pyrophosphohydrolase [Candidatus Bathyarchaeota archaeon]|nr:MAG: nucleotide pyrophosphohydrolase [Candidatus Bathyarchaeota archaeon]
MTSIREFQNLMHRLYFIRDSKRGAKATHEWLKEEVDELNEAIEAINREGIAEELADVLAWLASLANVLEVDLEEAALRKYAGGCPKCGSSPCICTSERKKS